MTISIAAPIGSGHCFARFRGHGRHEAAYEATGRDIARGLPDSALTSLSVFTELLLCGEESAAHVFAHHGAQAPSAEVGKSLRQIVRDEERHERMLAGLRAALAGHGVLPDSAERRRRARHFFLRLQTRDSIAHLARVAALDAMVTRLLCALQSRKSRFSICVPLMALLSEIRADEARHVQVTRDIVLSAPRGADILRSERDRVADEFCTLLDPDLEQIERVGIDPERLLSQIQRGSSHAV